MNVCIMVIGVHIRHRDRRFIGGRRSETQTAHRHQTGRAAGSPGCARLSRAEPEVRGTDSPETRVHARTARTHQHYK